MLTVSIISIVVIFCIIYLNSLPVFGGRQPNKKKERFNQSRNFNEGKFKYPIESRIDYSLKALKPVFLEYMKGNPNKRPKETLQVQRITKSLFNI